MPHLRQLIIALLAIAVTAYPLWAIPDTSVVEEQRTSIARSLETLDYAPAVAESAAALLTAEDLAVLSAHPEMLQRAGGLNNFSTAIIIVTLIIVGLVILAANGSGFVSVS
jgi:hypothetical protein